MTQTEQIKKLKAEIRKLKKLVLYDELTKVLNRRGFMDQANTVYRTLYSSHRRKERRIDHEEIPFSLIFLDADNFKRINDTFGHDAGDAVLKAIAATLKKSTRTNDLVGRFGGEEFVITLAGADLRVASRIAERIRERIAIMSIPGYSKLSVTASIGIATRTGEETLKDLITHADRAMYEAKQNGKNQVMTFHKKEESSSFLSKLFG